MSRVRARRVTASRRSWACSIRPGRITDGDIRLDGRPLVGLREEEYRRVRGRELAMVFQDPMTALNPVQRVGAQIAEAVSVARRRSS